MIVTLNKKLRQDSEFWRGFLLLCEEKKEKPGGKTPGAVAEGWRCAGIDGID